MHQLINLASIVIIVIGAAISLPSAAQVSLVHDGKARAVVVVADKPTETARYAADELVWHVERATGVALEVVPESEVSEDVHTRVYIGVTETAKHNGIDAERLPREVVARVLTEKVLRGDFSEELAVDVARKLLRDNVWEIYNLDEKRGELTLE